MDVRDIVKVISKASYKHYDKVGKIVRECNSNSERMFLVDFGNNDKARFYESSLEVHKVSNNDMSMVKMTVQQCRDLGLWEDYCKWSGCELNSLSEGKINCEDEIEFDSQFRKKESQEDIESKIIYGQEYYRKDTVYCIIKKVEFEYRCERYVKYLTVYRTMGKDNVEFELRTLEELKGILSLDKY